MEKIRFYAYNSNTPIKYYLICGYSHITNRSEVDRVEVNERLFEILSTHMRLNGDIPYTFIYNSKKELYYVVDKVIDKECEVFGNYKYYIAV
jgi:hypothetical protein